MIPSHRPRAARGAGQPATLSRRLRLAVAAALPAVAIGVLQQVPSSAATSGHLATAKAGPVQGWRIVFKNTCPNGGCGYVDVSASGMASAWASGVAGASGSPVTGRPAVARWHNGVWRPGRLPSGLSGLLIAVSTDSAKDAWAVSGLGGYALHWNGTRWSVARRWSEGSLRRELTGVQAFGRRDVWVFGGPGAYPGLGTWHFDGSSWTRVASGPGAGIISASALSPTDMWAIGSTSAPQDSIVHYTGTWRLVRSSVLSGLQFSGIAALAAGDVWAVATKPGTPNVAFAVHLQNGTWVRTRLPWAVDPIRLAADGRGGIWLTALSRNAAWAIHRSAAGRWSRVSVGSGADMIGLTLIPGTASLWGAGSAATGPGSGVSAIWAYGRVG